MTSDTTPDYAVLITDRFPSSKPLKLDELHVQGDWRTTLPLQLFDPKRATSTVFPHHPPRILGVFRPGVDDVHVLRSQIPKGGRSMWRRLEDLTLREIIISTELMDSMSDDVKLGRVRVVLELSQDPTSSHFRTFVLSSMKNWTVNPSSRTKLVVIRAREEEEKEIKKQLPKWKMQDRMEDMFAKIKFETLAG